MSRVLSFYACGIHVKVKCSCYYDEDLKVRRITGERCPDRQCEDPDGARRKKREAK